MESISFITLDVFTSTPFSGNPLSVIKIPTSQKHLLTQPKKQLIAREFNLSETVFIHQQTDPLIREWVIDIFTTDEELPFAGHPTIGSACFMLGLCGEKEGVFITKAGRIPIRLLEPPHIGGVRAQADIPHNVHIHARKIGDLQGPIPGLSTHPKLATAEMNAPIVSIVKGMTFLLIRLESLDTLGRVQNASSELSFHGILDPGWRESFVARYYYVIEKEGMVDGETNKHVKDGVVRVRTRMLEEAMEDPATGSAACALGSYLALTSRGTQKFEIVQGVEIGRRSVIGVEVVVDEAGRKVESVRLSGSAVQVMEGNLRI